MNRNEWQKVKKIFDAALKLAPEKRGKFLDENCDEDKILRREVENLLASFKDDSFMEQPAATELASLIVERNSKLTDGEQIAHYRILSQIGAGGMGEVYLAKDTRLHRKIALKILPAALSNDRDRLRRFEQEACAASALNHPNILTIYEIGETAKTRYIATEFVEGETLRERLNREGVNLNEALEIVQQIAFALSAAHAAGIVHRDIKPDNIMIRRDGIVKVLDFGLAKLTEKREANLEAEAETRALVKTNPGVVMGTVAYMSPEQARGKETDARTDVWSLGVVLYEMLTGRLPFAGETMNDSIAAILTKEPLPLAQYVSDVPAELQRIVRKALTKERDERYQTARDLLIDLKDIRQELEFQNKLERTASPNREESKTQVFNATTSEKPQTTSSVEYIATEIKQHKPAFIALLTILLLTSISLGYWYFSNRSLNTKQIESIAVMPFVNEGGNADTEYLSDGMTESLINSLSQLPKLSVKARSSVFRYKGKDIEPQQIANELSVQAILNGRVVQRGDNLSLNLELVDARNGNQIWGKQYNRKLTDIVSLQNEIAQDVSNKLQAKLSGGDEQKIAKNYTANPEAYQLYLQGRYHWNKRTIEGVNKATEYFQKAIEKDPSYALAYVGLADTYIVVENLPPREAFPKAKAATLKALEIDESLGESHAALAQVKQWYEWDWASAEREYKRAIELNPNYPTAHHWYAESLATLGRFDESFAAYNRALELDPLSFAISTDLGMAYYYARQYDRAIEHFKKLIELDPNYLRTHFYLAKVYEEKGMFEEALAEIDKGIILSGGNAEKVARESAQVANALRTSGAKGYWQKALDLTKEDAQKKGEPVNPMDMAWLYARLNKPDEVFEWLEKAYQERRTRLVFLKVEPAWDNLRSDPRFADLVRRVGLP